jgi:peptide/nickel transport system substrate-binding protein
MLCARSDTLFVAFFITALSIVSTPALAQKQGGTLRIYHGDNSPSPSIHEEAAGSTVMPFMGFFNNLVVYDQGKQLNTPIGPDLAESWTWERQHQSHVQASRGS